MTKISVIIPVYNAEKYIGKCLDSILSQTFKDFEVICINDLSQDGSLEILKEFSRKDGRIRIINNEKNLGAGLTRNIGIDKANGEYIYFIDSDDYIDEDYLEEMVKKIERKNADIVLNLSIQSECGEAVTPFYQVSIPKINPEGEFIEKISSVHDIPCFIWARIYRKSFLDAKNLRFPNLTVAEDYAFNTIVNLNTDKTFIFYGPKYHYTVRKTGLTGTSKTVDNRDLNHIIAFNTVYDYLKKNNLLDNRLKLYRVHAFTKVDTEEKFITYKKFFEKIYDDFKKNENIYNDLEKYFAYSILNSADYEEYLKNYNKVVTIGYLRQGKKQ